MSVLVGLIVTPGMLVTVPPGLGPVGGPAPGEAVGLPHPTLTWMAATHGFGNALGFALCALLARRRLQVLDHPEGTAT